MHPIFTNGKQFGLYLLGYLPIGAVLVIVTFGHLLKEPLYAFHEHVIPRLALVVFVLLMPPTADRFSIDHLLRRR